MTTEEIKQPNVNWSINNPSCTNCGSTLHTTLTIEQRERQIEGNGDITHDEYVTEYDLLEVRCSQCDTLLHRSDEYAAYLNAQRAED